MQDWGSELFEALKKAGGKAYSNYAVGYNNVKVVVLKKRLSLCFCLCLWLILGSRCSVGIRRHHQLLGCQLIKVSWIKEHGLLVSILGVNPNCCLLHPNSPMPPLRQQDASQGGLCHCLCLEVIVLPSLDSCLTAISSMALDSLAVPHASSAQVDAYAGQSRMD